MSSTGSSVGPGPRVVAVAVTFDRAEMVARLVRAAASGTVRPDEIVVVDNASTDDTVEVLRVLADELADDLAVPLRVLRLATNTGGAGGFHAGLEDFLGGGSDPGDPGDLVWLMDDDGVPAPDCLERLLPYVAGPTAEHDFVGPAVVAEHDPDRLCFPIRLPGRSRVVHDLADVAAAARDGLIEDVVIPFNGVLLTRALVQRIGTVREEFFIWGDDVEYLWRARAAGARIATVVAARFAHPATDDLGSPMMGGRTTYNHSPSDLKHYCMCRNNTANLKQYAGLLGVLAFWVKTVWFYTLTRWSPGRLRMSLGAMYDGFYGHWGEERRFLAPAPRVAPVRGPGPETVAVVVVTYNRADLLRGMLAGLAAMHRQPDLVIVVDNASTDHTAQVIEDATNAGLVAIHQRENGGGAGGFHLGVRTAYDRGLDRIWLMDDDVVPAADCLDVLMAQPPQDSACLMSVREDRAGHLVEKAALRFDLADPFAIKPKTAMVETTYGARASMPERVELENVAFEGFLVRRDVVEAIGLPDPSYFIFYDDVDYAIRARRAGFRIWGVRDAVLVRQLDFDQQHDLAGWKGFYMYRNLFVVHLRYGENALVRHKPWLIALAVVALSPVRGGWPEARNVVRAVRSARAMRHVPAVAGPSPGSRSLR